MLMTKQLTFGFIVPSQQLHLMLIWRSWWAKREREEQSSCGNISWDAMTMNARGGSRNYKRWAEVLGSCKFKAPHGDSSLTVDSLS